MTNWNLRMAAFIAVTLSPIGQCLGGEFPVPLFHTVAPVPREDPKKKTEIPHETIESFAKMGMHYGIHEQSFSRVPIFQMGYVQHPGNGSLEPLPGFQISSAIPNDAEELPVVEVPFALHVVTPGFTRDDLRRLSKQHRLTAISFGFGQPEIGPDVVKELCSFSDLATITLINTSISPEGCEGLAEIPNLTTLNIQSGDLPQGIMEKLGKCKRLKVLRLNGMGHRLTFEMMNSVAEVGSLTELDLQAPVLKKEHFQAINKCKGLTTLRLTNPTMDWSSFEELKDLKSLQTLSVMGQAIVRYLPNAAGQNRMTKMTLRDKDFGSLTKLTNLRHLELPSGAFSDDGLAELASLKNLETLKLRNVNITGSGFKAFQQQGTLKTLLLSAPYITDAGLLEIAKLPRLERLIFVHAEGVANSNIARFSEDGLGAISRMKSLTHLECAQIILTAEEHAAIAASESIVNLNISYSQCPNEAMLLYAKMKRLTKLMARSTAITDQGVAALAESESITSLDLAQCGQVSNAGVATLGKMKKLAELDLSFNHQINYEGLKVLEPNESLRHLAIHNLPITPDQIEELGKKFNKCEISAGNGIAVGPGKRRIPIRRPVPAPQPQEADPNTD